LYKYSFGISHRFLKTLEGNRFADREEYDVSNEALHTNLFDSLLMSKGIFMLLLNPIFLSIQSKSITNMWLPIQSKSNHNPTIFGKRIRTENIILWWNCGIPKRHLLSTYNLTENNPDWAIQQSNPAIPCVFFITFHGEKGLTGVHFVNAHKHISMNLHNMSPGSWNPTSIKNNSIKIHIYDYS